MDKQFIKETARDIIVSHTEDIEFLSVWEMTEERLSDEYPELSIEETEKVVRQVDSLINKATVTITFEDD